MLCTDPRALHFIRTSFRPRHLSTMERDLFAWRREMWLSFKRSTSSSSHVSQLTIALLLLSRMRRWDDEDENVTQLLQRLSQQLIISSTFFATTSTRVCWPKETCRGCDLSGRKRITDGPTGLNHIVVSRALLIWREALLYLKEGGYDLSLTNSAMCSPILSVSRFPVLCPLLQVIL